MLQFSKEAGHRVEETKLRVVYVDPPRPPSPVREGSEEGSSPRASVSDNGASDFTAAPRFSVDRLEPQENSSEARALITRLTEEKNSAIQLNNRLQQELEKLKRESKRSQSGGGIPFMYVLLTYAVSHRCCWLSTKLPCCALLKGIANLEAAVCLCTALKANVLGINLNVPVDLSLLLNYCGKKLPYGLQCA
ncbi:hypothetical protein F2Q70_00028860 [Brassica cretica]|uniref:Hydrophobic seed protein domain-containing protein n=1 Tax=Brassica cretica TaxID=69181 RepID=A0A8S9LDW2_BRACR|nr:hypothetical protein F2Q70_00028860 [Brassica cretica]